MIDAQDIPVVTKYLTIKDVVEIVGYQPLDVRVENKWIVLVFPYSTFRMRNTHGKN